MSRREVKAFIHRNRVADVVNALNRANFHNISVVDVQGILKTIGDDDENRT